jgi:hypothetical protein
MMKQLFVVLSLLGAFVAGIGAERLATGVSMRGRVVDANTIEETIEYWEVRSPSGESVVITGRNDVPMIKWLRQSRNRSVIVNIDTASGGDSKNTVMP